jgi:hypothetical protein
LRGDDQVGAIGDLRGHDQFGIGLHGNFDTSGTGRRSEAVFAVGHDDPYNVDTAFAQHVQCGHAEMAGADEGNPHGGYFRHGGTQSFHR